MKKFLNNPYLNLVFRIVLGLIFLIAATSKIADMEGFAKEIGNYQIVPEIFENLMAITIPWIELVCAIFIISGIRIKSSVLIIGVLIIIFNVAIFIAIIKGLNINCGCHTQVMAEKIGWQKILENTGLLLMAVVLYFNKNTKFTIENYVIKKSAFAKMAAFRNLN